MMFWAGTVIGAVLGACAMCVVSYNRDQEYQRMLMRAHTRSVEEQAKDAEERERYIRTSEFEQRISR